MMKQSSIAFLVKKLGLILICVFVSQDVYAQDPFWEKVKGPYTGSIWASFVTSDGTYYAGTSFGEIYRKKQSEEHWTLVMRSPETVNSNTILSFVEHDGFLYASDAAGNLMMTEDNGNSWTYEETNFSQIRSIFFKPTGEMILGTLFGLYERVIDEVTGEVSWEQGTLMRLGDDTHPTFYPMVYSIATHEGALYAATVIGVYQSDDNGISWSCIGFSHAAVFSIDIEETGDVYIGTDRGLFVHYNGNDEWTTLAPLITHEAAIVRSVAVINNRVFFSDEGAVYYSDNDEDWIELPFSQVRSGFYQDNGKLVLGTFGEGIWTCSLTDPLTDIQQIGIPDKITHLYTSDHNVFAVTNSDILFESNSCLEDDTWTDRFKAHGAPIKCYAEDSEKNKFINLVGIGFPVPLLGFTKTPDQLETFGFNASPFPFEVTQLNQIFVTQKDMVLVATNAGVYHFNSETEEVKRLSKLEVSNPSVLNLADDVAGNIYAGSSQGFYVSSDDGKTWSNSKLADCVINEIFLTGEREGYVATDKGLYYFSDIDNDPVEIGDFSEVLSVVKDKFGGLYFISSKTVYYCEDAFDVTKSSSVELRLGRPTRLLVVDSYIYLATDAGLYKHKFAEYASVTLNGLGDFVYDGSPHAVGTTTDPAGLNVTVTYNNSLTVPQAPGLYRVKAVIDSDTYAGEATGKIFIGGMPAEVTITTPHGVIYDGQPHPATASTYPSQLDVVITYNGETKVPVNAGTYVVKATVASANYEAYSHATFTIDKAQQFITFEDIEDRHETDDPFVPKATSSVGLPITFNIGEGPAEFSDGEVKFFGPGKVSVNAVQQGSMNYYAANTVTRSFFVFNDLIMDAEDPKESRLSVYPIPADDRVTVECKEGIRSVTLTDVLGKVIQSEDISSGVIEYELSLALCKQSMVLMRIRTMDNEVKVKRVLLNR